MQEKNAWPLVKRAREEGKKSGFRGGFAFIEEVCISVLNIT